MSHSIFALADDLTGALEVGAKFAVYGLRSVVVTDPVPSNKHDSSVLVVDTESRHLCASDASARVRAAAALALHSGASLLYKKTDSTLRGNIAAELHALAGMFPNRRLIYAPAYPDMGRTVKSGELFVWGTPVHQTEFAHDRWNPVQCAKIESVLGDLPVSVLDGECNADIELAARTILAEPRPQVCAGPAALAGALAFNLQNGVRREVHLPKVSRCLVVNGSLHEVSSQQMQWAEDAGFFNEDWVRFEERLEGAGLDRAVEIGERVAGTIRSSDYDGLVVFGGDTAFGIHRSLGAVPFEPIGEVTAGVPISRSAGLWWVTKAGGFGAPDVLGTIRERLT